MAKSDQVEWLDRGWYPFYFGFCPSETAWKKEMKKMGCPNEPYPASHGCTTSFYNKKDNLCIIVTVREREGDDDAALMGLLVHEAVHVKQKLMDNIGERSVSSETEAYSVQAIFMSLLDAYTKTRHKPTIPSQNSTV